MDDARAKSRSDEPFESDGESYYPVLDLKDGLVLATKARDGTPAPVYVVRRASRARAKAPKLDLSDTVMLWTDGSCLGNPGPGGWAYVRKDRHEEVERSGGSPHTTNNRMEMTAAIEALKSLSGEGRRVVVYSDSQLVIKTMTDGWKRKANQDLWQELDCVAAKHEVSWRWVRGHDGQPENERCDELAQAAAASQVGRRSK